MLEGLASEPLPVISDFPADTPTVGTLRLYNVTDNEKLYIYCTAGWKTVTLSTPLPLAISDVVAVDNSNGTATITFTNSLGAVSQVLYWMVVVGGETAADIVAGGTAVGSPTSTGTIVATGDGSFGFVVVATNPTGSVNSNKATATVTG